MVIQDFFINLSNLLTNLQIQNSLFYAYNLEQAILSYLLILKLNITSQQLRNQKARQKMMHQEEVDVDQRFEQQHGDQSESNLQPNQNEDDLFDNNQQSEDLMDDDQEGDVASSDSELQVQDPTQSIKQGDLAEQDKQYNDDPMRQYYAREDQILAWLDEHPGQKWTDNQFLNTYSQFYEDQALIPDWSPHLKNLQWRRPQQIIKDPKFMIVQQDKFGKNIDIDSKHGSFAKSWFISSLTMIGTKAQYLQKLIVQKQYFDKGFVSFQFFKNGKWVQVIVDTVLPYQKQQNNRNCVYSSCNNPQEFWISLMEKAYVKLHGNYQKTCKGDILECLVDLTGGISQINELQTKENTVAKVDHTNMWNFMHSYYQQKFFIGCINTVDHKTFKNVEQGQQGILQNHYYTIIDMRDYPKDNLKLIRVRNAWGSQGVWTGPFCQEADDWEKYKAVKQDVKNSPKTKKSDGSWWINLTDFMMQFDRIAVSKVFPENWQIYSIQGQWAGKTNGGRCPANNYGGDKTYGVEKNNVEPHKTAVLQKTQIKKIPQHFQQQSDDRWFNNPQFRIKVTKDTKLYISLMQQDQKLSNLPYVPTSFMIAVSKSRSERIWERPPQNEIIAQVNPNGVFANQRQVTHYIVLKKFEKAPGVYMIIPNIVDTKETAKKQQSRKFYLRLFSPDSLDVTQLSQTLQTTVQGQWNQSSAGGSRKIQIKQEGNGKKKGDIKQNPNWCKNPQYFLSIKQPTMVKIILRKLGVKKYKGWKIGMTVCRYEVAQQRIVQKQVTKQKRNAGHNLKRLLQQTNQYLQPPVIKDVQRKLLIQTHEKFKQSSYFSQQVSALFFKWNPTQGPFIIIPSSDGQDRYFGYKLTVYSNNPVQLIKLQQARNQVAIGKWQKDISAGGCHLNQKDKQPSHRTWSMNPKYHLCFKQEQPQDFEEQPVKIKITLAIAQKNWKKLNPNTVSGMIGLYFLQKRQGKLVYSQDVVIKQTSFLPVKQITLQVELGVQKGINKNGYIIMPSTYESKIQGSFILSVKCQRPFQLIHTK